MSKMDCHSRSSTPVKREMILMGEETGVRTEDMGLLYLIVGLVSIEWEGSECLSDALAIFIRNYCR